LTWDLAALVAVHLANQRRFREGGAVVLAFDCLLRCGELTNLRREDVAFPKDRRMGHEYKITTLSIRVAKTGRNQSVTVASPEVVALLRQVVAQTPPRGLLFPGGSTKFQKVFKSACQELGLSAGQCESTGFREERGWTDVRTKKSVRATTKLTPPGDSPCEIALGRNLSGVKRPLRPGATLYGAGRATPKSQSAPRQSHWVAAKMSRGFSA
jgi:hypothetical protein